VVGTDGVFDNLFDDQIKDLLWPFITGEDMKEPTDAAEAIAVEAERLGADPRYMSPFAKNAHSHFYNYKGGK